MVARALKRLQLPISVSHEILPEFREYERLATVVINAFLAPRMGEYLKRLERGVGGPERRRLGPSASPTASRGRSRPGLRDAIERGHYDGGASGP